MLTTTPAWQTAAQRTATQGRLTASYQPILLVELLGVGRVFATRAYAPGGPRLAGDGALAGAGLLVGAQWPTAETLLARVDQGGVGSLRLDLDEVTDAVRLGGASVTLLNQEDLASTFAPSRLDNMPVRMRLGFVGLGPTDFVTLFSGAVDRHQMTHTGLEVALVDGSVRSAVNLSVPIGGQYFPGAPPASRNQHIPLLLGINVDAPTIQVSGDAAGSLAFAVSPGASEIALTEFGAPFPASGTLSLGSETGVTYTSRTLTNLQGTTYLLLGGLTRGAPAAHTPGEAVTLTDVVYQYLIGYEVSRLNTVRNNGVVVDPGEYTVSTVPANRPVSVLTFATPQGTVTVDVNAGNIDDTELLTNGGFETGDTTGWTLGAGATATVGATNPLPEAGDFRLQLTGALNTYGELSQEVATTPGEDYRLSLVYQEEDANLLVNGGFETGDLTGWTLDANAAGQIAVVQAGQAPILPNGQRVFGGLGQAADGQYYAYATWDVDRHLWQLSLFQDVATTIGLPYVVTLRYAGRFVTAGSGGAAEAQFFQATTALAVHLGTPATPNSLGVTALPVQGTLPGWTTSPTIAFTATATTTRLTIVLAGIGVQTDAPPLLLDAARMQQANVLDTSQGGYRIGTPTTPTSYADVALGSQYQWTAVASTFRATSATTRITLRSRYTLNSQRTAFDHVQLNRQFTIHSGSGGQNPVEALAYVIRTFTTDTYDATAFATAYLQRIEWKFGTVLTNPGDSKALLQRMAQQCHTLLYQDSPGRYTLKVLDQSQTPVWGFDPSNVTPRGSLTRVPEPLDNVYTEIYVWFGAKTGGSTSAADFAGVTYATPTETTHPSDPALPTWCASALALYGRPHRLDLFADCLQDFTTANLLLATLVRRRTVRHDLVTCQSWLDAAPLQLGDVVQVQHPVLAPDGMPLLAEVVSVGLAPQTMSVPLTLRTLAPAGWTATFDYAPTPLLTGGWSAAFDATETATLGEGWSAAFDTDEVMIAAVRRQARREWPEEDEPEAVAQRRSAAVL